MIRRGLLLCWPMAVSCSSVLFRLVVPWCPAVPCLVEIVGPAPLQSLSKLLHKAAEASSAASSLLDEGPDEEVLTSVLDQGVDKVAQTEQQRLQITVNQIRYSLAQLYSLPLPKDQSEEIAMAMVHILGKAEEAGWDGGSTTML